MTRAQNIQVEQSTLRQRIHALLDKGEDMTEEERAELEKAKARFDETEGELRAALVTEEEERRQLDDGLDDTAENREMRSLSRRTQMHRYVSAAIDSKSIDGAEAELNQALEIRADGAHIPLFMLLPEYRQRPDGELYEERVDAVTALNALDGAVVSGRFLPRVFPMAALTYLAISRDMPAAGSLLHTVMTGGTTAATVAVDTQHDAVAATFGTKTLEPHRLTGRYIFRYEDAARLAGLEERLRQDMSMVMSNQQDKEFLHGNAQLSIGANGLIGALGNAQTETLAAYGNATGVNIAGEIASLIDGIYCTDPSQANILIQTSVMKNWLSELFNAVAGGREDFIYETIRRLGWMFRSSWFVKGADGNLAAGDEWALASKSIGREGAATIAMWPSVELIRDPFTKAGEGQVVLTAIGMWDCHLNRADNFRKFVATAA